MNLLPPLSLGKWRGLGRIADDRGRFKMLAADQRPPLQNLVAAAQPNARHPARQVAALKRAIVAALAPASSAALLDPLHALPGAARRLPPRCGLVVTLERHDFAQADGGRLSAAIPNWSAEKIKRLGGDAVKILVWHHPRAAATVRRAQREFVRRVGAECRRLDLPLVLELLLYPPDGDAGYAESPQKRPGLVLQSVRDFADPDLGADVFKLESPVPAADLPDPARDHAATRRVRRWFRKLNDAAGRPWVLLSAGAPPESFARALRFACESGASGYLAGRAFWMESALKFPDLPAVRADLQNRARPRMDALNAIVDQCAVPWTQALCGRAPPPDGFGMQKYYPDFGGRPENEEDAK